MQHIFARSTCNNLSRIHDVPATSHLTRRHPCVPPAETILPDNFGDGYGYAIASYSSLVLEMFKKRCTALSVPAATCKFTLTYA